MEPTAIVTLILSVLDTQAKVFSDVIGTQTADQKKVLWDRYIELTDPLHKLLVKFNDKITGTPAPAVNQ